MTTSGTIALNRVQYKIDVDHAFEQVLVVTDNDKVIIGDLHSEILAEHTGPAPSIRHVGNGRPPGTRPRTPKPSPMSWDTNCHQCPEA